MTTYSIVWSVLVLPLTPSTAVQLVMELQLAVPEVGLYEIPPELFVVSHTQAVVGAGWKVKSVIFGTSFSAACSMFAAEAGPKAF